jgi:uncharacterized protein YdbL (DUF1318 family)
MKNIFITLSVIIFALGCARVSVQGSKEPIKLDISMRLDIYQHVQKDIDSIEDIVAGEKPDDEVDDKQGFLHLFASSAYAQGGLSQDVEQAALRRKGRLAKLRGLEEEGVIGENKLGLVELRGSAQDEAAVKELIGAENKDRMVIYKALAAKNNTSLEGIQKVYAQRLQDDAPSGTPVEVLSEASNSYKWKVR